ncbi:unnamed protein product [Heligmosomoides polygyrus]|uniref:Uncharacterized protein n=1 Tax=Heligmosomoides polygyrus TaxID=6339 RepID=A0A183G7D8_HELPZ|nr:unnamed protein product [Heligmosomoides polygyrus]
MFTIIRSASVHRSAKEERWRNEGIEGGHTDTDTDTEGMEEATEDTEDTVVTGTVVTVVTVVTDTVDTEDTVVTGTVDTEGMATEDMEDSVDMAIITLENKRPALENHDRCIKSFSTALRTVSKQEKN